MKIVSCVLGIMLALPAGAQQSRARPDSGNVPPRYPDMLRAAHVGGTVRVRVAVDTAGRLVPESFTVLRRDHDLLVASVRSAMVRWRFMPAHRDGRAIPDTIEQDVTFSMPTAPAVALARPDVLESTTLAPGRYRLVIGWPGAAPLAPALDPAVTREIALSVLDTLVASLVPAERIPARVVCVGVAADLNVSPLDAAALERLARPQLAVVVTPRCPPTLASMIVRVAPDGGVVRPPPGEDPWFVEILQVQPYTTDIALAEAVIRNGTGTSHYRCRADRDVAPLSRWRAACEVSRVEVSSTGAVPFRSLAGLANR